MSRPRAQRKYCKVKKVKEVKDSSRRKESESIPADINGSGCEFPWTQEEGRTEKQRRQRFKSNWSKEEEEEIAIFNEWVVTLPKMKHPKSRKKAALLPKSTIRDSSTPSPASSPSPTPANVPVRQGDQKRFAEAALRMVAEEMLPLSFVESVGFRTFMGTVSPQYNKLSQRTIGMLLYENVEKTLKPQLIRDLKAHSKTQGGGGSIHVTFDIWLSDQSKQEEDPVVVVQLHFVSDSWQILRPVVAFRKLRHKDLNAAMAKELEDVLLGYGIFPHSIGYVLVNPAKQALAANSLFCDYNIMCSSNRGDPGADELGAYLSDQNSEVDSHFSEVQIGTRAMCVAKTLQMVIKDALKTSRVVENLLSQVHNVVAFFRKSSYWSEVLLREYSVSLCPPTSSYRWNSMMMSLRRIVQQSSWTAIMTLLTQARTEAHNTASAPPLVMAKRDQVMDILGLLELFEEALQVLQGNDVTISFIIPSLVGLDKALENYSSTYTHFSKALRQGLCTHFQSLVHQTDMILGAVLDPRIKLQPFADDGAEDQTTFLTRPTKHEAYSIVEKVLGDMNTLSSPAVLSECVTKVKEENKEMESQVNIEGDETDSSWCNDVGENYLKRKSIFTFLQPPEKKTVSELDVYLSESLWESNCSVFMYWKSTHRFPKLQSLAKRLLAMPATSGGFDRLCPMATCIVRARRSRLPVNTTERLLLYKYFLKTQSGKRQSAGAKQ